MPGPGTDLAGFPAVERWVLFTLLGAMGLALLMALIVSGGRDRFTAARFLLWLGALGPFIATIPKSVADVSAGLGPLDVLRGTLPIVCLALSHVVGPMPRRRWGATEWFLAAYLVVALTSTYWSVAPKVTLLRALLLAFAYANLLMLRRHYATRHEAAQGLATTVHVLLLLGAAELPYRLATYPSGQLHRMGLNIPRISSNLYAYLAVAGIIAVLCRLGPAWTRRGINPAWLLALYTVELLYTRTRSALVVGALVGVMVTLRASRRSPAVMVLAMFAIAGAALTYGISPEGVKHYLQRGENSYSTSTLTGRTVVWRYAEDAWHNRPAAGAGYYAGHRLTLPAPPGETEYDNIDNTWLESLVDVGLLGTVPLALFALCGIGKALRRDPEDPSASTFVAAVAVYGIAVSFFNPTIHDTNMDMVLLGFILLMPSCARLAGNEHQGDRGGAESGRGTGLRQGEAQVVPSVEGRVGAR